MERRTFLALGGAAALTAVGGCLDAFDDGDDSSDPGMGATPTATPAARDTTGQPTVAESTPTGPPTETEAATRSDDATTESPLAQFTRQNFDRFNEYPDYGSTTRSEVPRLVPYDAVDPADVPIYLEPSTTGLTKDGTISFTLSNGLDDVFNTNFYNWHLHKQVDGAWFDVTLSLPIDPLTPLEPGESHTWTLEPSHDAAAEIAPCDSLQPGDLWYSLGRMATHLRVPGLGGGQYAFGIRGWFGRSSSDEEVAFTATFRLDAGSIKLSLTEAIADVTEDGETVTAVTEPPDPDVERDPPKRYRLDRLDESVEDTPRIITEQLWRDPPVWDAFSLLREHDVESAVVVERDGLRYNSAFGQLQPDGQTGEGVYEYEGECYELSVSNGD